MQCLLYSCLAIVRIFSVYTPSKCIQIQIQIYNYFIIRALLPIEHALTPKQIRNLYLVIQANRITVHYIVSLLRNLCPTEYAHLESTPLSSTVLVY